MRIEILGIDHIFITVSNLEHSILLQNPDGTYRAYTFESLDRGNIASEHTLRPEEPVEVMPRSAWPPEVGAHTDRLDQEAVERLVRS